MAQGVQSVLPAWGKQTLLYQSSTHLTLHQQQSRKPTLWKAVLTARARLTL